MVTSLHTVDDDIFQVCLKVVVDHSFLAKLWFVKLLLCFVQNSKVFMGQRDNTTLVPGIQISLCTWKERNDFAWMENKDVKWSEVRGWLLLWAI